MPTEVVIDNKEYVILSKNGMKVYKKKHVYEKYNDELLSVEQDKARSLKRIEDRFRSK